MKKRRNNAPSVLAEMPLVVVENAAKAQSLLDKAADLRSLRCLVVIGDISEQNRAAAATTKIKLVSFQDVLVRTLHYVSIKYWLKILLVVICFKTRFMLL